MGRGGHRYPIEHAEGRELDFASLLWEALLSDRSPQGVRFRSELDGIFLRWRRLVDVLNSYRASSWNGPSSDLQHLVDSLKSLTVPTRVVYPRPHSTPEIEAEIAERSGIAAAAIKEVCGELITDGRYVNDESKPILSEATRSFTLWQNQPFWDANPGRRHRYSNHPYITRYICDVEEFCSLWGLKAWWAVPSIIDSHFKRESMGEMPPLSMYLRGLPRVIDEHSIVVELPELDERGSSCFTTYWRDDSHISPAEIQIQCEKKIGRAYSKRASRELSRQVTPQLESAKNSMMECGWTTAPNSSLSERYRTHAGWVANLILNPEMKYEEIWPESSDDKRRAHQRSCANFARLAKLNLPSRNVKRSRNLHHW
jgi:hypothetical protein